MVIAEEKPFEIFDWAEVGRLGPLAKTTRGREGVGEKQ